MINRLIYAYRRFVHELPVWGSASIFIKIAAENRTDAFGIDWRQVHDAALTTARVISPEDAAGRALEELQEFQSRKDLYPRKILSPNSSRWAIFHMLQTYTRASCNLSMWPDSSQRAFPSRAI